MNTLYKVSSVLLLSMMGFTGSQAAQAALKTKTLEYKQGDTKLQGYLAYDDSKKGNRPGVIVVHEWMGLGQYVKDRAKQIAKLGYVVLAADIYGKGVRPKNQKQAAEFAEKYKSDRALLRARIQAALDTLREQKNVSAEKIAALGYCFGGTTALELARSGADVSGVISFHGNLDSPTPEDAKNIKSKVLVLHGADDPFVPEAQVLAFQDEMKTAKVDWQLIAYGGAVHGFTQPKAGKDASSGFAYNERADKRSWEAMLQFFEEIF